MNILNKRKSGRYLNSAVILVLQFLAQSSPVTSNTVLSTVH